MWTSSLSGPGTAARGGRGEQSSLRPLLGRILMALSLAVPAGCAAPPAPPQAAAMTDAVFLDTLEQRTFQFFWDTADPETGLIPDRYPTPSFCSIAAVGFGLAAYPIGAERGYVTRDQAAARVLKTLRFLERAPQNADAKGAAGYKGFFYHFLDMKTGLRFEKVELSSIDTALLISGALTCRAYFDRPSATETEIRGIAERLNARVEWPWFMARPNRICMGWSPEGGFITYDWHGYMEGMSMLVMALGSPTHPVPAETWPTYTKAAAWGAFGGQSNFQFGPLFGHQFSHIWIDFKGVRDAASAARGLDYAENTRRATYGQRAYAMENPGKWKGYGPNLWGISACDGPADVVLTQDGLSRRYITYGGRGVSTEGILDDGTLTPNAAAGSLPFAPEIALPALQEMRRKFGDHLFSKYGFLDAFNETFPAGAPVHHGKTIPGLGWVDTDYLGIDQGLILCMAENYRTGLLWNLLRKDPTILRGMKAAGFKGGWVDAASPATKE